MKTLNSNLYKLGMLFTVLTLLIATSCKKNNDTTTTVDTSITGPDLSFYALSTNNVLLNVNAKSVSTIIKQTTITGLQTGETILGIDFRPATGQLYGVGSTSRIYVINPQTGAALAIGTAAFTPAISGTAIGLDFNPTVDRIRLVTNTGQNLRLHPETGATAATDGVLNGATNPVVTAAAYNGNRAGASTTVLFVIDVTNDKLYKQDPPNDGKLVEVGGLGFDAEQAGDFDISPDGTIALAALKVAGKTNLYSVDLSTGKANKIMGEFGSTIIGIAIPTEPVAYSVSTANELVVFNPLSPTPVAKAITGLATGENILGIDFRPVNGALYALGSTSRIYTLNTSSGVATAVSAAPLATLLSGTDFGFDFNPTVDRVRVISNTGQNLRLNPIDGTVAAIDGVIAPATSSVTAAAYTNNFAGATTTVLYDIDAAAGRLYKQDPPNNGTLVDVGPLGVAASTANGFDIGSTSGIAYALLTVNGVTKVYTINLITGVATAGATISGNVRGFTIGLGF